MLSLTEFIKKIKTPERPISVLLGNGLGLSHPDKMVRDGFIFDFESVFKKYKQHPMEENINCPEEFLGYRRELLLYYRVF